MIRTTRPSSRTTTGCWTASCVLTALAGAHRSYIPSYTLIAGRICVLHVRPFRAVALFLLFKQQPNRRRRRFVSCNFCVALISLRLFLPPENKKKTLWGFDCFAFYVFLATGRWPRRMWAINETDERERVVGSCVRSAAVTVRTHGRAHRVILMENTIYGRVTTNPAHRWLTSRFLPTWAYWMQSAWNCVVVISTASLANCPLSWPIIHGPCFSLATLDGVLVSI